MMLSVSQELRSFETSKGELLFHRLYGHAKEVPFDIAKRVLTLRDSKQQFQSVCEVGLESLAGSGLLIPVGHDERAFHVMTITLQSNKK